jgi:hypothetical protein
MCVPSPTTLRWMPAGSPKMGLGKRLNITAIFPPSTARWEEEHRQAGWKELHQAPQCCGIHLRGSKGGLERNHRAWRRVGRIPS